MKLLNNSVLVQVDEQFDWLRDSKGKPFLKLVDWFSPFNHAFTTGKVVAVSERITGNYPYGTTIEIQAGDDIIFDYLAIHRDRDGHKIEHPKMIDKDYIINYKDVFCAIRNNEIIMCNGWVILEKDQEDFKLSGKLWTPRPVEEKTSNVTCTIRTIGSKVSYTHGNHSISHDPDPDGYEAGQKVIVPVWACNPLMQQEHSVVDTKKMLYRSQRRWFMPAEVLDIIKEHQLQNPVIQSTEHLKTVEALKEFKSQEVSERPDHQTAIHHKQTTKHKRKEGRVFIP